MKSKDNWDRLPQINFAGTMMMAPVWAGFRHTPHGGCEIIHVIQGRLDLEMDAATFCAGPGDTLLVPVGIRHRDAFDVTKDLEVYFATFVWAHTKRYFQLVSNELLLAMPDSIKIEVTRIFDLMRGDVSGDMEVDQLVLRARLYTVLMIILRHAVSGKASESGYDGSDSEDADNCRRIMELARDFVDRHYSQQITLQDVADAVGISAYHLSHVFSRESGGTLCSYLMQKRLENARHLLLGGKHSVKETAHAVGFNNSHYFSSVFKKRYGKSPSQIKARKKLAECPGTERAVSKRNRF